MTTITLRARDSAEAFEKVEAQLGRDALILSTELHDGWVVVTASDDHAPTRRKQALSIRPSPPASTLRADAATLRDSCLRSKRVVLLGPLGAGKTRVALQLAYLRLLQGIDRPLRFVAVGFPSHSDAALLVQKAAQLGEDVVFAPDGTALPEAPAMDDLVVVSGLAGGAAQAQAAQTVMRKDDFGLLVLPHGISGVTAAQYLAQHGAYVRGLVRVEADADLPVMGSPAVPLPQLWTSVPAQSLEGLQPPQPAAQPREVPTIPSIGDDR